MGGGGCSAAAPAFVHVASEGRPWTEDAALGGGTTVYLLATVVISLAVRRTADQLVWLWLGSAAATLVLGLVWPIGLPIGLIVLIDLVLVGLVAIEAIWPPAAGPDPPAGAEPVTGAQLP